MLRPFRGVRFSVDDPGAVTSPPYDLISDDDVQALLDSHPNNVVRLILPRAPAHLASSPQVTTPIPQEPGESSSDPATLPKSAPHPPTHTSAPQAPPQPPSVNPHNTDAESAQPMDTTGQRAADNSRPQPTDTTGQHSAAQASLSASTVDGPTVSARLDDVGQAPTHRPHPGTPHNPHEADQASGTGQEAREATDDEPSHAPRQATPAAEHATARPQAETQDRTSSSARRYGAAREALRAWLADGVLVRDDRPALYVYEQQAPGMLQRGLIGDVGLAAPEQRVILPHENVMPGPVADRLALMSTTQANLEPILLLYNGNDPTTAPSTHADPKDTPTAGYRGSGTSGSAARQGRASRLVDEVATTRRPLVTAQTTDGVRHSLWAITDRAEIDAVNADLRHRQALIADGHHRYATYRELQRHEHARRTTTPTTPAPTGPHAAAIPTPAPSPADATNRPGPSTDPADVTNRPGPSTDGTNGPGPSADGTNGPAPATSPAQADHMSGTQNQASGPWDFGLALLVDSDAYPPDLKAIHRVIPGLPLEEAAARAKGAWRVQDFADLPSGLAALREAHEPAFLLAGEGGGHLLTDPDPVQFARAMPADRSARWNALNTSVLTEFVMPRVWGMRDDEVDVRIVHHDAQAAADLAATTGGTAVILNALAVDDVLAVAAEGERVPRKSTSFGPKPRTGLVLRTLDAD
ncbi:DUF1015 family protein [Nonomuraea sp. NPDC050394]|uniref:DUF1015 family protein n=1 Tax=Nonomuraea sp. NPDC050394 TaxID=3364363 RepID=UPI0037B9F822